MHLLLHLSYRLSLHTPFKVVVVWKPTQHIIIREILFISQICKVTSHVCTFENLPSLFYQQKKKKMTNATQLTKNPIFQLRASFLLVSNAASSWLFDLNKPRIICTARRHIGSSTQPRNRHLEPCNMRRKSCKSIETVTEIAKYVIKTSVLDYWRSMVFV